MNLVVLCDFDGTITHIDTAEFTLIKFAKGDWKTYEVQFENGEITLEECLTKEFSLVKASKRQILDELKNVVTFRPNFGKLVEHCRRKAVPLTVVSAGLDFVIKHFLKLNGWDELVEIYSAKTKFNEGRITFVFPTMFDRTSVNFKHDLVRQCKSQGKKVVYIGDGSGDYAAARESDYLFAVKGSKLEMLCKKQGTHYTSMTDFREVIEEIRKLTP